MISITLLMSCTVKKFTSRRMVSCYDVICYIEIANSLMHWERPSCRSFLRRMTNFSTKLASDGYRVFVNMNDSILREVIS